MRHMRLKRVIGLGLLVTAGVTGFGRADNSRANENSPSNEQIAVAKRTSDLMLNELVAALFQEFNETTTDNVEEGKQSISLIFNNSNRDMRLIGVFQTLLGGDNDLPSDSFEQAALSLALQGQAYTSVESVDDQWYYRRSVALSNSFHQSCALFHANFTARFFKQTKNPGQWVGALMLRVPIKTDE